MQVVRSLVNGHVSLVLWGDVLWLAVAAALVLVPLALRLMHRLLVK